MWKAIKINLFFLAECSSEEKRKRESAEVLPREPGSTQPEQEEHLEVERGDGKFSNRNLGIEIQEPVFGTSIWN